MRKLTHEAHGRDFGVDDHPEYQKVRGGPRGVPQQHEQGAGPVSNRTALALLEVAGDGEETYTIVGKNCDSFVILLVSVYSRDRAT